MTRIVALCRAGLRLARDELERPAQRRSRIVRLADVPSAPVCEPADAIATSASSTASGPAMSPTPGLGADLGQEIDAVAVGQHHVEDDHTRWVRGAMRRALGRPCAHGSAGQNPAFSKASARSMRTVRLSSTIRTARFIVAPGSRHQTSPGGRSRTESTCARRRRAAPPRAACRRPPTSLRPGRS